MRLQRWTSCAMGLSVALTLSAVAEAKAQTDTTRRDTSQVRIPVRKGMSTARVDGTTSGGETRRESAGDVATLTILRIDSIDATTKHCQDCSDAIEAANT